MQLIGGDTTRGPLSMTLGIHGFVPPGRAETLRREAGDWIYVTGTRRQRRRSGDFAESAAVDDR
jgi:thiamine monophosphate kinase